MDVRTITMNEVDAALKFYEYREAFKKSADKTDRILMKTYKALGQGKRLLNLVDVIRAGGLDELHRPNFAVARADCSHVWFSSHKHSWTSSRGGWPSHRFSFKPNAPDHHTASYLDLPDDLWPECPRSCAFPSNSGKRHPSRLRAMVPLIPPQYRPVDSLSNYHILWDVQGAWEDEAPRDPFLLKHIDGDLYAVVAAWDLTDLEMAVLKGLRARV